MAIAMENETETFPGPMLEKIHPQRNTFRVANQTLTYLCPQF
jgi:hypothetical protein